ncbi:glycosyltransferase family 4 protein [Brevundimonas aveniformis]|uniref:glycosyltransferase family 4 protein n=1 Tax=Brevundimonas aveniformis TaxID=370977 RepID=UPI00040CFF37|nr:MraY family glycosyltransferase [Brevundimonas aveniformis]
MIWAVLATVLLTGITTVILSKVGPVDHPRDRGLSIWSTATAGGLAVIGAVMAGVMLYVAVDLPPPGPGLTVWLLLGACIVGFLGAIDDVLDVPALPKLIVQIVVALAFSILVARVEVLPLGPGLDVDLGPILGVIGTTLWVVVVMNAYNFMDGSDGLAVGVQSIGLFTLALVNPDRPILAFALLAASISNLAFLPYNHPGKRIFQGDCGALFSSFLIAGASVLLATGPNPRATMYLGAFVAAPLLVDVLLTLLRRALARRPLFKAHTEHLYQRWLIANDRSPGALAWRVWVLTAACAGLGYAVNSVAPDWSLAALTGLILLLSLGWYRLGARLDNPDVS